MPVRAQVQNMPHPLASRHCQYTPPREPGGRSCPGVATGRLLSVVDLADDPQRGSTGGAEHSRRNLSPPFALATIVLTIASTSSLISVSAWVALLATLP